MQAHFLKQRQVIDQFRYIKIHTWMNTTSNEYYISFVLFPQALKQSINFYIEIGQLSLPLPLIYVQMLHSTGDKMICNNLSVIIYRQNKIS